MLPNPPEGVGLVIHVLSYAVDFESVIMLQGVVKVCFCEVKVGLWLIFTIPGTARYHPGVYNTDG